MRKILVVDLICEPTHLNWLKRQISILELDYDVTVLGDLNYIQQLSPKKHLVFESKIRSFSNKFLVVLNQVRVLLNARKLRKSFSRDALIYVVGFENISYSLLGWKNESVYLHLHNNLDRSSVSLFFLKYLSWRVRFVAYESYFENYFKKDSIRVSLIHHPLNFTPVDRLKSNEDYIFVPSLVTNILSIESLIKFGESNNLKVVFKSNVNLNTDTVESRIFFENYNELFSNAKFIALISPYNYRISGIFYEAMLFNKPIILLGEAGLFMKEMQVIYPNSIYQLGRVSELDVIGKYADYTFFLKRHSDVSIRRQMLSCFE